MGAALQRDHGDDNVVNSGVFATAADTTSPFVRAWDYDSDNDPSPVGFHESRLEQSVTVDANCEEGMPYVQVRRLPGIDVGGLPCVELEIGGRAEALEGWAESTSTVLPLGEAAYVRIRNRETIRAIGDAMRYAADRADAVGLLNGLPGEAPDPVVVNSDVSVPAGMVIDLLKELNLRADTSTLRHQDRIFRDGCDCPKCEAARAKPFTCQTCGYAGAVVVARCTCLENWTIARDQGSSLARIEPRPEGICGDEHLFDDCAHGESECPVCGSGRDDDNEPYGDHIVDPWSIVRGVRAIVRRYRPGEDVVDGIRNLSGPRDVEHGADEGVGEPVDAFVIEANRGDDPALADANDRIAYSHKGETFTLFRALPPRRRTTPISADAQAVTDQRAWLLELSAAQRARRAQRLIETNGAFAEAFDRISRCLYAWPDRETALGDEGHASIPKLQAEYIGRLEDASVVDYDDDTGVFITDERVDHVRYREPGLYGEVTSCENIFDLVLGDIQVPTKDGPMFGANARVYVNDDETLQAIVTTFLERLLEDYGPASIVRTRGSSDA